MNDKSLVTPQNKDDKLALRQNYVSPAVDIYELDAGLTLVADMPGVTSEQLHIDVDQGILSIEAAARIEQHGDRLFQEFSPSGYYRQFRLPEHIDVDKIDAKLTDGVLTLKMSKAAKALPKRIEVKTVH
jgi:HSP20 family molecular chaperone IbpA